MGGTSLSGGSGTILGTVVGALVISLVRNGMNLLNVPSFWQQFVIGSVIILGAALDQWRKRQMARV
jgi:ribose transport system permease protein